MDMQEQDMFPDLGGSSALIITHEKASLAGAAAVAMGQEDVGSATLVSQEVGEQLPVKVCGRICQLDRQKVRSIVDLQAALQHALGMHEQDFVITDKYGAKICTDMTLREALDNQRIPLGASLSDASVHYIENRREELAQMQWKVVRDKMQACTADVESLCQQLQVLKQEVQIQSKDSATEMGVLRSELTHAIQQEHTVAQVSLSQIFEKVTSVINLINAEQNKREFSHQNLEHQIQELRCALDEERAARLKETGKHLHLLQDGKVALESHKQIMESVEKQHAFEFQEIRAQMGTSSRNFRVMLNEQMVAFKTAAGEITSKARTSDGEIKIKISELQSQQADLLKDFSDVESNLTSLEGRLSRATHGQAEYYQRINERQEQLLQTQESMKIEKQQLELSVHSSANHIKELEVLIARSQEEGEKVAARRCEAVRDELQRTERKLVNDRERTLSDLEENVTKWLEEESNYRDSHTKQIYEEISKVAVPASSAYSSGLSPKGSSTSVSSGAMPPKSRVGTNLTQSGDNGSDSRLRDVSTQLLYQAGVASDSIAITLNKPEGRTTLNPVASPVPRLQSFTQSASHIPQVTGTAVSLITMSAPQVQVPVPQASEPQRSRSVGQAPRVISMAASPNALTPRQAVLAGSLASPNMAVTPGGREVPRAVPKASSLRVPPGAKPKIAL